MKVPISQCLERAGQKPIGVRWVDVQKKDGTYRSRLVAKEVKTFSAPDLVAATPPIESIKFLIKYAAAERGRCLMHLDVSRAYFYAHALRDLYVEIAGEDRSPGDENRCGRLIKKNNVRHQRCREGTAA